MLSIQTNVNSLVAQQNLSTTSMFQSKTIQQLTSGYRINSSGDDAAGLAVANKFRNTVAELTQGVANGNDAVAQLQIMDGGMNNISQVLDRLKTLALQSSSATFTGSRATLNAEFQTDLKEVDRQAQSIGLNTAGTFAKSLGIYLGAGSGSLSQSNSIVTVDLSKATVDTQSLGMSGYQAVNAAVTGNSTTNDYDLGNSNGTTNVAAMIAANGPQATSTYTLTGPGFGDSTNGVSISLDNTAITDTASLVQQANVAIQNAAALVGTKNAAFKAANIVASIHTDAAGKQQLAFSSNNTAFQITATNATANAFIGNWTATPGVGKAAGTAGSSLLTQGAFELGTTGSTGTSGIHPNTETDVAMATLLVGQQDVTLSSTDASGSAHALTVHFDSAGAGALVGDTVAHYLTAINTALQNSNDASLKQITAVSDATSAAAVGNINFISTLQSFSISAGPATTSGGMATTAVTSAIQVGSGGTADISTIGGALAAVTAISGAVNALGAAQANIGKGQNQVNYAINLANSQITNFAAAESAIRDTNVAQQAANLTKAQVLQQASIAAMAQANSAPQAILKLLG